MSFLSQPITLQSLFGAKRVIGPLNVQVIVSEETNDTLTITKQPVQEGASISDHAYKEPTVLNMQILQQNNSTISGLIQTFSGPGSGGLAQIYQTFLDLQNLRGPINVYTPKRVYENMLISVIRLTTDRNTENILALNISFQEVIIVSIGGINQVPKAQLRNPKNNQATQPKAPQSGLETFHQGVKALLP